MKLLFYTLIQRACNFACTDLHETERHLQWLRGWAWLKASREELRNAKRRAIARAINPDNP